MICIATIATVYLVLSVWSAGAAYANFKAEFPSLCSRRENRKDAAFCLLWGFTPLAGPLVLLFMTGFYQDGWLMPGKMPTADWLRARADHDE